MINCDYRGCRITPIVECRCPRCDREPDPVDRDHSCAQHCDAVAVTHKRRSDRDVSWQPYVPPSPPQVRASTPDVMEEYARTIAEAERIVATRPDIASEYDHCVVALAAALREERAKVATATETLRTIVALVRPL